MLEFFCDYKLKYDMETILQLDYSNLLSDEHYFCIKVNEVIFFEQPLFPILEFLYHYLRWDRKHDFIYNTIESQENPILEFRRGLLGWKIDSVWKKFDCKIRFDVDDFVNAVNKMINSF